MFGKFLFSREIAALRRRLERGPPADRRTAIRELVDLCILCDNPKEAVAVYESLLRDADEEVASMAWIGLSGCHEHAMELLCRLVEHPQPQIRAKACNALGSMQEEVDRTAAQPSLLAALSDGEAQVRGRAAYALGQIQDSARTTVDALAAMAAHDADAEVRSSALHAMGRIGRKKDGGRAVAAHRALFLSALKDPDAGVRWSACYAFQTTDPRGSRALPLLLECLAAETAERTRQEISGTLFWVAKGEDLSTHLPMLIDIAKTRPEARSTVFSLCSHLGSGASALLPLIRESLASETALTAIAVLRDITGNDDEAIPALENLLEKGEFQQRFHAARQLLEITGRVDRIVPMLERALTQSPDEPGMFIQEVGKPLVAVAPALARAIDKHFDENDWDVMWNLTCAMAALESSDAVAVAALCKALAHPSDRVQSAAVQGLAAAGPAARGALPALKRFEAKLEDRDSRRFVRDAIRAIEKSTN